jgi:ABC-type sugar transport system permease subunit
MIKKLIPILRILAVLLVILLAWNLRAFAVKTLPIDFDEDDYLRAAQEYAAVIRSGDLRGLSDYNYRPEHPPLLKILYGWAIAGDPEVPLIPDRSTTAPSAQFLPQPHLTHARTLGAVFGTLTVALVALLNPLAGLFLGIHTWTIKYTSQVMLESLPALTSLLAVLAYRKAVTRNGISRYKILWLAISAVFLGLTAASKYLYCVIGIAILVDWYWLSFLKEHRDGVRGNEVSEATSSSWKRLLRRYAPRNDMLLWGILSILIFFAANPYLWPDPLTRLSESVFYHTGYASSAAEVQRANFPIWQPFNWLGMSVPWSQDAFRVFLDPFITLLAAFGLARLWKKERVYVLWLGIAILFLLAWPTKWPQYILILTVPLSLAAAEGARLLLEKIHASVSESVQHIRASAPRPLTKSAHPLPSAGNLRRAAPWLIPGLLAFLALTIFPLLFQFGMSMTTLNAQSLRDGLQGGLVRELWGGLTGQIPVAGQDASPNQVHYVGLRGYGWVFDYINSLGLPVFTILWTTLSILLQVALGLGAALLLWNRRVALRKTWQLLFILPWAIPEAIGALMWLNIFAPLSGWLSLAVKEFGAQSVPFSFLVGWERNPNQTLFVLLVASLWYGFPFIMLAASAGLKMLPAEAFDAAAIDGANAWQTFRLVTWPLLMPLLVPAIIIRAIFAFNQFYLFQMFIPYYANQNPLATLSTYSYYLLYRGSEFGISATINIINILMLVGLVLLFNRWSKAGEGVTYA